MANLQARKDAVNIASRILQILYKASLIITYALSLLNTLQNHLFDLEIYKINAKRELCSEEDCAKKFFIISDASSHAYSSNDDNNADDFFDDRCRSINLNNTCIAPNLIQFFSLYSNKTYLSGTRPLSPLSSLKWSFFDSQGIIIIWAICAFGVLSFGLSVLNFFKYQIEKEMRENPSSTASDRCIQRRCFPLFYRVIEFLLDMAVYYPVRAIFNPALVDDPNTDADTQITIPNLYTKDNFNPLNITYSVVGYIMLFIPTMLCGTALIFSLLCCLPCRVIYDNEARSLAAKIFLPAALVFAGLMAITTIPNLLLGLVQLCINANFSIIDPDNFVNFFNLDKLSHLWINRLPSAFFILSVLGGWLIESASVVVNMCLSAPSALTSYCRLFENSRPVTTVNPLDAHGVELTQNTAWPGSRRV